MTKVAVVKTLGNNRRFDAQAQPCRGNKRPRHNQLAYIPGPWRRERISGATHWCVRNCSFPIGEVEETNRILEHLKQMDLPSDPELRGHIAAMDGEITYQR
jgi:hypothetical protein